MYYLRDGLKSPALAWIYALVAGVAALTTTPFTQTNSIALVMRTIVGVPPWITGIAVAVLTWLVIIGGIKSIGRAAEKLTPLKVGLYLSGGLFVIVSFASHLPGGARAGRARGVLDARGRRRQPRVRSSRCGMGSRAGCMRTKPATARRLSPTAPPNPVVRCSRG